MGLAFHARRSRFGFLGRAGRVRSVYEIQVHGTERTQIQRVVAMRASSPRVRQRGFTLMEMIVVIAIMMILVSISVPAYNRSIVRAREAALRQNLFTLRAVINHYTEDKEKAPQSLDDLLSAGYLKHIPVDPYTGSSSTWQRQPHD